MANVTVQAVCTSCHGTGLYSGMAERDGLFVVCSRCDGTGCMSITYEPFIYMARQEDVVKVIEVGSAFVLTPELTEGGVTYDEFLMDREATKERGKEAREWFCPAWWYNRTMQGKQPDWEECRAVFQFTSCVHWENKAACWERFDEEQRAKGA